MSLSKPFRFSARSVLLTYPKCDENPLTAFEWFKNNFPWKYVCVGQEHHKDGDLHLHAYIQFTKKFESVNCRVFDLDQFHPNIVPSTKRHHTPANAKRYCAKEGFKFVETEPISEELDCILEEAPIGKRKNLYFDYVWYRQYKEFRRLSDLEWPITINYHDENGQLASFTLERPDPSKKNRNLWIVGPPNAGKTWWINHNFGGRRVFLPGVEFPYEGYDNQDLIVYDDHAPKSFSELANIVNTHNVPMQVAGKHRYTTLNWMMGHTRTIIVLSNKTIQQFYDLRTQKKLVQDDNEREAYMARFTEIKVTKMVVEAAPSVKLEADLDEALYLASREGGIIEIDSDAETVPYLVDD